MKGFENARPRESFVVSRGDDSNSPTLLYSIAPKYGCIHDTLFTAEPAGSVCAEKNRLWLKRREDGDCQLLMVVTFPCGYFARPRSSFAAQKYHKFKG